MSGISIYGSRSATDSEVEMVLRLNHFESTASRGSKIPALMILQPTGLVWGGPTAGSAPSLTFPIRAERPAAGSVANWSAFRQMETLQAPEAVALDCGLTSPLASKRRFQRGIWHGGRERGCAGGWASRRRAIQKIRPAFFLALAAKGKDAWNAAFGDHADFTGAVFGLRADFDQTHFRGVVDLLERLRRNGPRKVHRAASMRR
jgi:hypothetical protein